MRTNLISKGAAYVAVLALSTLPLLSAPACSMPTQDGVISSSDASTRTKSDTEKTAKALVLARNTVSKTDPAPAATTTGNDQKTHNKKTISRCWKRLMNMVREVNHAHTTKNK